MKIFFAVFSLFAFLILTTLLISCSRDETEEGDEMDVITNIIVTPTESEDSTTPDSDIAADEEEEGGEEKFVADFTVTLGTFGRGADLLDALVEEKHRVSKWSAQILSHPDFPVEEVEIEVDVIVMSLLEMGFLEDELVTLETILKKGRKIGLEACPPELAAQLRLQFVDQPDWATGDRLGEFFVAGEAIDLADDGTSKIFSIIRDDAFPHADTGIGLWLIANNIIDAADEGGRDRLFDPLDPEGDDLGGRFAFVIPADE